MRFQFRLRTLAPVLVISALLCLAFPSIAQDSNSRAGEGARHSLSLSPSFNQTTKPFKFQFVTGPISVGASTGTTAKYVNVSVYNAGIEPQQYLAEVWGGGGDAPSGPASFTLSSGVVTLAGDSFDVNFLGTSYCSSGCTHTASSLVIKIYTTSEHMSVSAALNTGNLDQSYTTAGNLFLPSGAFQRSVMTSAFSFGSSAGVCSTLPEGSIKVSASNVFPGSPVFGSYGWQNSGTASNFDTCSNNAYADLFNRSSANVSGAGKWTFVYQVPNGVYDVTILYNTVGSGTAGPTVITLNGRTVVNGVSDAPGNLETFDARVNVGGNQLLVGVSSPSGTAALNGVILVPVVK